MASSNLVLHCGARPVTLEELREIKAPPPEGRWYPLAHGRVVEAVTSTLRDAGYEIRGQRFGLTRSDARMFGVLDLATSLGNGTSLAVGIRNSVDKSFPLGFCAGSRVFVCDNLAFRSELLVRRKHTVNGERNFVRAIGQAVTSLNSFKAQEQDRIKRLLHTVLTDDQADALILRSYERGIISSRELPLVLHEWRNPSHEDFTSRTAWSLLNAYTSALKDRAATMPHQYALQTMRLNGLLSFQDETATPLQVQSA